ncbi:hypothetical protein [Mycoplasma sp. 1458C]|uniref:hypothetical protein n=1 Tax=unclassified Mycoplasma TaxID=2683645 RepID=UPI003AAD3083
MVDFNTYQEINHESQLYSSELDELKVKYLIFVKALASLNGEDLKQLFKSQTISPEQILVKFKFNELVNTLPFNPFAFSARSFTKEEKTKIQDVNNALEKLLQYLYNNKNELLKYFNLPTTESYNSTSEWAKNISLGILSAVISLYSEIVEIGINIHNLNQNKSIENSLKPLLGSIDHINELWFGYKISLIKVLISENDDKNAQIDGLQELINKSYAFQNFLLANINKNKLVENLINKISINIGIFKNEIERLKAEIHDENKYEEEISYEYGDGY